MRGIIVLFFAAILSVQSFAYGTEIVATAGFEAGYAELYEVPELSGIWPHDLNLTATVGFPIGNQGKLLLTGAKGLWGYTGGLGWGGEWYTAPWFSLEAGVLAKVSTFEIPFVPTQPRYLYFGVEPVFRANVLLFDDHLVLGLASGAYSRWLDHFGILTGAPLALTLGVRF